MLDNGSFLKFHTFLSDCSIRLEKINSRNEFLSIKLIVSLFEENIFFKLKRNLNLILDFYFSHKLKRYFARQLQGLCYIENEKTDTLIGKYTTWLIFQHMQTYTSI